MATVYWYGDGGNWSDHTNHWSNTSGGAGGADPHGSAPGTDDDVVFDANSFTAGSQTVTVDATSYSKNLTFTGATNSPDFKVSAQMRVSGNITFINAMTATSTGGNKIFYLATCNITTNGLVLGVSIATYAAAPTEILSLQDSIAFSGVFGLDAGGGTFNTNNYNITAYSFILGSANAKTVNLGSSTITLAGNWTHSGTNLTLAANTATINVAGLFTSTAGIATYHKVNLTGATSTITGDNTIQQLGLTYAGAQAITFTDGTTTTVTNMTRSSGTDVKTLVGSSTAGWAIAKAGGGKIDLDYLALSYSTATAGKFYAGANSTNTVGNVNWIFTERPKFKVNPALSAKIAMV